MAAGNFTMTIEHLDGDSTTFSIPSGAGQQTGPQTLVLKIPLPSKDGEIDKSVEASVIVRPVYSNGSSYVSQVLAGNFPTPTKLPQNGMRVFERKVKGIGTMVLYVFRVMTGCRSGRGLRKLQSRIRLLPRRTGKIQNPICRTEGGR